MKQILFLCVFLLASAIYAAPTGGGVSFDGTTGYRVEAKDLKLNPKAFSIAVWVRVAKTDTSNTFLSLGSSADDITLYLHRGGVRMIVENAPATPGGEGKTYSVAVAPLPKPETWTHYLGTYDGETISVYKDGVKQASTTAPCKRDTFKMPLLIGTVAEKGRELAGSMDDIRLWNRALTADEIQNVFKGEAVNDSLIAAWDAAGKKEAEWTNSVAGGPKAVAFKPGTVSREVVLLNQKDDGYRGIWYMNQPSNDEFVFKYSGGLGTYLTNLTPFAFYAPKVDKTFFCYGGTDKETENTLLHEISYFDHKTGTVPRPTILLDKKTNDAHDNPVINIDDKGYIWIFSSSHGTSRPSFIHRSKKPYDIEEFERINPTKRVNGEDVPMTNFSYFQVYHMKDKGFTVLFTTYDKRVLNDPQTLAARILCSFSSPDGVKWSEWKVLAGTEYGHYQSSGMYKEEKVGTAFNFHPNDKATGRVGLNYRTNLYYAETFDCAATWKNIKGETVETPLLEINNKALVHDYFAEGLNVYTMDVNFDSKGNPIILYLTSKGYETGPKNDPRRWLTARWTGTEWRIRHVCDSNSNYDFGSLYVEENDFLRVIGTTEQGPQLFNTGGEVAMWTSKDLGSTWKKERQMTANSELNHAYPRRPVNAHPDFYAFWASGHGRKRSESTLYFSNKNGDVYELPRQMSEDVQKPKLLNPAK
ncbi:MAG: BNR-4 repeat-containing protein [Planctomycetaceae bacterium]|nr:BNR-4 repeat-containing protein [Planctomycetaceae bacterium]